VWDISFEEKEKGFLKPRTEKSDPTPSHPSFLFSIFSQQIHNIANIAFLCEFYRLFLHTVVSTSIAGVCIRLCKNVFVYFTKNGLPLYLIIKIYIGLCMHMSGGEFKHLKKGDKKCNLRINSTWNAWIKDGWIN